MAMTDLGFFSTYHELPVETPNKLVTIASEANSSEDTRHGLWACHPVVPITDATKVITGVPSPALRIDRSSLKE